jgi:hypothetical protein
MVSKCLRRRYPNIFDLYLNSAFTAKLSGQPLNRWCHFWNLLGDRTRKPCKFECEVCHEPMHNRNSKRLYMVCNRCLHRYIADVRWGKRQPVYHVRMVAVQ